MEFFQSRILLPATGRTICFKNVLEKSVCRHPQESEFAGAIESTIHRIWLSHCERFSSIPFTFYIVLAFELEPHSLCLICRSLHPEKASLDHLVF
jgi:hypothetical protein